jgi:isoleucyl-tRNA synthetase
MDYSLTVNLPKTDFPMKADLPKREPGMLDAWSKEQTYQKALERRRPLKGKKQFILHDGPPYANGNLHLGHALNKILKDIIVRFKTMAGFYAPYVPGWDCHGLPIELQLMKELKVTDKHKVNREQFREQARAFAEKFVEIQREEFKRMGILGDWQNPYLTMAPEYKKKIIETFQELEKKGYVYRGLKPVYWCATDETALAEAEVEYENDPGPSIFVAFPIAVAPKKRENWLKAINASYVIWTTTPWTLPANVAVAYNPNETYVFVEEGFVLAEKRVEEFRKLTGYACEVEEKLKGSDLEGSIAAHPWISGRTSKLVPADFVAMDTGTGLVHIAPGHGREDYVLGMQQNPPLPILSPVTDRGLFTDAVPEWQGQHVFKANPLIIEFLKQKGRLLHAEELTHSYPHCWRCHKPVIFRATEQWFLNVEHQDLRQRLLKAIESVHWVPGYGQNRITGMVQMRPDWCLSRQRLWGTEIPAPPSSSPAALSGGSTSKVNMDPPLTSAEDDGNKKTAGNDKVRDPDIVDVWFESGVSWAAVLEQRPELSYPADMYLEGSDQHRGWFQTSLIPSVAIHDQAPFKTVLTHGFVMDGEGRPMSKSLGNVISPQQIIQQYGADVLRLWVASVDYGGDVRVSPEILKGQAENYRKVRNTLRYFLGNLADFNPQTDSVPIEELHKSVDRWALHVLQKKTRDVRKAYDAYEFHRVVSSLVDFGVRELSGGYLDIIKDRLYCEAPNSPSRRSAQTVLYRLADTLIRLWAPILPFTMDESWKQLRHNENIALADLPEPLPQEIDDDLGTDWPYVWQLREEVFKEIEVQRKAGKIGSSLEAWVTITTQTVDFLRLLEKTKADLPMLLIVSKVDVSGDGPHKITVRHAQEAGCKKCARCWNWRQDVGVNERWAEVCGRCAVAMEQLPKEVVG